MVLVLHCLMQDFLVSGFFRIKEFSGHPYLTKICSPIDLYHNCPAVSKVNLLKVGGGDDYFKFGMGMNYTKFGWNCIIHGKRNGAVLYSEDLFF